MEKKRLANELLKIAKQLESEDKLEFLDIINIEINVDKPDVFSSEDGFVRLAGQISKVLKKELDIMKRIGVKVECKISTKSGDWKERIKNF